MTVSLGYLLPTRDLLAGSNIRLESRGHHALKGIEGERAVFRVLG